MATEQKKAAVQPTPQEREQKAKERQQEAHEQKAKNLQAKIDRLSKLPSERKDVKIALARTQVHLAEVQKKIKST
jgi:hypothetical protein